ncbi:MAG: Spy/CpxP family protein refolding chaperone [Kiritimatiellia bacterium]
MKRIGTMAGGAILVLWTAGVVWGQDIMPRERGREKRTAAESQRVAREERVAARQQGGGSGQITLSGLPCEALVLRLLDNPRSLDQLGNLTDEQKEKLEELFAATRDSIAQLHSQLQAATADLERLLAESTVENVLVTAAMEKVGGLRTKLGKEQIRCYLALKQILTPEQFRKLEATGRAKREKP